VEGEEVLNLKTLAAQTKLVTSKGEKDLTYKEKVTQVAEIMTLVHETPNCFQACASLLPE
jgi:hypothetical protein